MGHRLALRLALRIAARLQRALGENIETQRMVDDVLYARDVLLVCDALHDTDLPALADRFRRALADAKLQQPERVPMSIGRLLASVFGPATQPDADTPAGRRRAGPLINRGTAAEHVARAINAKSTTP